MDGTSIQQGEVSPILRLINRRLGGVTPEIEQQIRSLSVEQLENLGEALKSLTEQEIRSKELAEILIKAEKLSERRDDKIASLMQDDVYAQIHPEDIPPSDRFLKQVGSSQQIEQE